MHKTMTHNDDEFLVQKKNGNFFTTIGSEENMPETLVTVLMDGANDFAAGIMSTASSCNNYVYPSTQANTITLMVVSGATEGCVDPLLLPESATN